MERKILSFTDIIFTIFLALAFTAAPYYINDGNCKVTLGFILSSISFAVLLLFIVYVLRKFLSEYKWNEDKYTLKLAVYWNKLLSGDHATLWMTMIIFASWLIPLCLLYPGTFINDTWGELQQFIGFTNGSGTMSDHHPVFDTLVMSIIIVPLSQITGKWHLMIFIYVLLQAVLTSLAFANTANYALKKLDMGIRITTILVLSYCLLPIFPAAVQTVSKDALHSWGFTFFIVLYIELIRTNGKAIKEKNFLLKFLLITSYCCLTKKVGFYVVLLSLSLAIIFVKNNRKYLLIPIGASILLMNVIMPIVRTTLQISPGGKQEMFSLPFQMTARYVKFYGDDITDEEYEVLDKVLTMETLADRYNPTDADPVKDYYQKAEDKYYAKYIKVWIKQGLRHPEVYISAFNSMLSGWFSWSEYAPLMNNDWRSQHNTELIPEWVPIRRITDSTANAYQEMYHNLYNTPVIRIFLSYGFYASLLPAFAVCTVFRKWEIKEIKYWLAIVPNLFALMLGCWLAPVSYQLEGKRYLYPVVYTIPIIIVWCLYIYKSNKRNVKHLPGN